MYNYPKLGSFVELKRTRSIDISKKYAREVYKDAENVIELDGNIYFNLVVTWTEPDSLMVEPMPIATIVFCIPKDTSTKGTIYLSHKFHLDALVHPDYNTRAKEIKGSLTNFIKEL